MEAPLETKIQDSNFAAPAGISDANFATSPPTPSDIPMPVFKKTSKKNRLYLLLFLPILAAGFYYYRTLSLSPEIILARSIGKIAPAQTFSNSGTLVVDIISGPNIATSTMATDTVFSLSYPAKLTVAYQYLGDYSDPSNPLTQYQLNYRTSINNSFADYGGLVKIIAANNYGYILASDTEISTGLGIPALTAYWISNPAAQPNNNGQPDNAQKLPDFILNNPAFKPFFQNINLYATKQKIQTFADFGPLAQETINGSPNYRVHMDISKTQMQAIVGQLKQDNELSGFSDKDINTYLDAYQSMGIDLWADKKTLDPEKINLVLNLAGTEGQKAAMNLEIDDIALNPAVKIALPGTFMPLESAVNLSQELAARSDQENLQGLQLQNSGQDDQAKPLLEQAITDNPNNYQAYNNLGLLYEDKDDYADAIQMFNRALAINPQHDKAAFNIIDSIFKQHDYRGVVYNAGKFILAYPQSALLRPTREDLANAYRMLSENNLAIAQWQLVLQLDPNNLDNYNTYDEIGANYFQLGQYNDAAKNYQQSVDWLLKNPKADKTVLATVYQDLASAYFSLKQYNDYLAAMDGALKAEPELKNDQNFESNFNGLKNYISAVSK